MAESNQVGIYWGANKILCVGSDQGKPTNLFGIPFNPNDENISIGDEFTDSGNLLVSEIQQAVANNRIKSKEFNLALPTKEIIFRSFVIPMMPANEVAGAVVFEAGKYVPFSLEELKYSFHPIPIEESGIKKYRVIFVAIRKDTLEEYKLILAKAGMAINAIEPAQLSLSRTLSFFNLLPETGVIAIVEADADYGKITIVSDKIPVFVRDFQLQNAAPLPADAVSPPADLGSKLTNELKISLDYFARQDRSLSASKLILISEDVDNNLPAKIQTDLNIEVSALSTRQVLGHKGADDINYLNAFGSSIFGNANFETSLNFSETKKKIFQSQATTQKKTSIDIKKFLPVGALCLAILGGAYYWTNKSVGEAQAKIDQFKTDLGEFKDSDRDIVDARNSRIKKKQKAYDKIRIKSDISKYLQIIPTLLPEGAWLENMEVTYQESGFVDKPVIKIDGFVYHENVNEQFRLVHRLQRNLKKNESMTETFKDIDLMTTDSRKLKDNDVTYFKIKCN